MNSTHYGVLPSWSNDISGIVRLSIFLGISTVVAYGLRASSFAEFISIAAIGSLMGAASLSIGGFLGFLFSLPRSSEKNTPTTNENTPANTGTNGIPLYARNNNLGDISDWLTKILVGAGLAQLGSIPSALKSLGATLAPALGNLPGSGVFAVGIVIYFGICGFFALYLWTSLKFLTLLSESDMQAQNAYLKQTLEEQEKTIAEKEKAMTETMQSMPATLNALTEWRNTTAQEQGTGDTGEIASLTRVIPENKRLLWVDDHPENNHIIPALIKKTLNIDIETSSSTEDALAKLKTSSNFTLIISDMVRGSDPEAGYTLLKQLRSENITTPFVIFKGSIQPEDDAEAQKRGALGCTNNPMKLLQMVTGALKNK